MLNQNFPLYLELTARSRNYFRNQDFHKSGDMASTWRNSKAFKLYLLYKAFYFPDFEIEEISKGWVNLTIFIKYSLETSIGGYW